MDQRKISKGKLDVFFNLMKMKGCHTKICLIGRQYLEGDYSSRCPCEKRRKVPYQLPQLLTLESKRKEGRKEGRANESKSEQKKGRNNYKYKNG